jgi:hypothetical protein
MAYIGKTPTSAPLTSSDITDGIITKAKLADTYFEYVNSDITALALREATNETSAAFNLPNQFIETFTDDTNLGTQTDGDRDSGYWSTIYTSTVAADAGGTETDYVDGNLYFSSVSSNDNYGDGNDIGISASSDYSYWTQTALLTSDFRTEFNGTTRNSSTTATATTANYLEFGITSQQGATGDHTTGNAQQNLALTTNTACSHSASSPFIYLSTGGYGNDIMLRKNNSGSKTNIATIAGSEWGTSDELSFARNGSTLYFMINGVIKHTFVSGDFNTSGNLYGVFGFGQSGATNMLNCHYRSELSAVKGMATDVANATGTLIQSANTVASAKTKVGGTILYKDNAGTATLGTDLKIYFTCDNSNWTEADSYNAITPVYSTGIKQVRLGETTCTSGTDVRYKAVWANQAASSKETQLHGIGVNY